MHGRTMAGSTSDFVMKIRVQVSLKTPAALDSSSIFILLVDHHEAASDKTIGKPTTNFFCLCSSPDPNSILTL